VHHLAEPSSCIRQAVRVVREGGLLFFRDLLRPSDELELASLVNQYVPPAGHSTTSDHGRAMFAASLRAALKLDEIRDLVSKVGFPAESVRQTSDRHWTWAVRKQEKSRNRG
jgi:ubiquinone/menaquinone biosynthesis C-methylase UbiE